MLTIYRYHPMFQAAKFDFWYPEQTGDKGFNIQDLGRSSLEGGDVQPIGYGTVAIGCSERTQARMIEMVAKNLFEKGAAERVLVAMMGSRAGSGSRCCASRSASAGHSRNA